MPPCSRMTSTLLAGAVLPAAKVGRNPASDTRPPTPRPRKLRRDSGGNGRRIRTLGEGGKPAGGGRAAVGRVYCATGRAAGERKSGRTGGRIARTGRIRYDP